MKKAKEYEFPIQKLCENCKNKEDKDKCFKCKESINQFVFNGIYTECLGFYQVFNTLEPDCFLTAYTQKEYPKCKENKKLLYPYIVNGAFSSELALKWLIYRERQVFVSTHDLKELFYLIPEDDLTILKAKIENGKKDPDKTVDEEFEMLRNCFQEWRYAYEKVEYGADVFMQTFVHTICDYVIEKHDQNNKT